MNQRCRKKKKKKKKEERRAGSDSLHADAKSLAVALFTFGNAGLEISKAKQKAQQTSYEWSGACCGTSSPPSFFSSASS